MTLEQPVPNRFVTALNASNTGAAKVTALGCSDLNFDGDKTKNMICDAIKKKFEGQSWFAINDRTITVNLEAIMQGKGVSISGCLVAADICDDKICLSWERRVEAQYE